MKKIGIVTYWNTEENYGQILQLFALQHHLKQIGISPFLIKWCSIPNINKESTIKRFFRLFTSYYRMIDAIKKRLYQRKKTKNTNVINRDFKSFKEKYIECTSKVYSIQDLKDNPPVADGYITGSDQVWNYPNSIFLLSWCHAKVPRFSYAASFGTNILPKYLLKEYKDSLSKFKAISVREKSGIDFCHSMGLKAEHVLDPTLLLSQETYNEKLCLKNIQTKKPYIFLYLLGNESTVDIDYIKQYALYKGWEIIFTPSQNYKIESLKPTFPSIEEWISLIANAEIVITNSFHGTIFSIIYKRQFYTILLKGRDRKMNDRILSLFTDLNIKRIYNNHIDCEDSINYEEVYNKLRILREKSFAFINQIMNHI